jgi:hypothetical protein
MHQRLLAVVAGGVVVVAAAPARAGNCVDLPNPVVIESGDTQEPLLKSLGQKLRASTTTPITIVYVTTGSCTLISDMYAGNALKVTAKYVPSTAENPTWTPTSPSPTCSVDATAGVPIDLAISALFVSSCTTTPAPAGLGSFVGPIQGYGFVVPNPGSTQLGITSEEAYFTFGFGAAGLATPWIDPAFYFIRPTTKSTLLTLAAAIRLPGAKWLGQQLAASTDVVTQVSASTSPEKTIGILGLEIADKQRSNLKVLAFQAPQQKHAYWPDSTAAGHDRRNIRDGHYLPWSPTVYLTKVDASGVPTNARAKTVIDLVLGNDVPGGDVDGLKEVVSAGLVPDCAMMVKRDYDGGALSLYTPAHPCGCYYEATATGTAPASCVACTTDSTCGAGKCRHGYCEVL